MLSNKITQETRVIINYKYVVAVTNVFVHIVLFLNLLQACKMRLGKLKESGVSDLARGCLAHTGPYEHLGYYIIAMTP